MKPPTLGFVAATAAVLGIVVRLAGAWSRPLSSDEAVHAVAGLSLLEGRFEPAPAPFSAMLTAASMVIGGTADWAPRLPAIGASGLLLFIAWRWGDRWVSGQRWILVSLLALTPLLVFAGSTADPVMTSLALAAVALVITADERAPLWLVGAPLGLLAVNGLSGHLVLVALAAAAVVAWRPRSWLAVGAVPLAVVVALIAGSAGGTRPEWLVALSPLAGVGAVGTPDGDPFWYAPLVALAYAPLTLVFAVIAFFTKGLRVPAAAGAVAALGLAILLLAPEKSIGPAALWVASWSSLATLGMASIGNAERVRSALTNPWFLVPVAATVFGWIVLGFLGGTGVTGLPLTASVPDWLLLLAGLAAVALPVLLLVALLAFGRVVGRVALAAVAVALVIFEIHTLSSLQFDAVSPELVARNRGSVEAGRARAAIDSAAFSRLRVLADQQQPLLIWWQAGRRTPQVVSTEPRLLQLVASAEGPLAAAELTGVLDRRWDGRFDGPGGLVRWLLQRQGVRWFPTWYGLVRT